jgi:hypothetical protein
MVLAVPQIPELIRQTLNLDERELPVEYRVALRGQIYDLLLPVFVPDGSDVSTGLTTRSMPTSQEVAQLSGYPSPTYSEIQRWLTQNNPPYEPEPGVSLATYNPIDHRPNSLALSSEDANADLEWVTVVTDGRSYAALNDAELAEWREVVTNFEVLGQAIRPTNPASPMLREASSRLGLFKMDMDTSTDAQPVTVEHAGAESAA